MLVALTLLIYALIGSVIGRILFRTRLGASARYAIERDGYSRPTLTATVDNSSAQTYGLWSIPLWPLTLAIFLIQAPTPHEKRQRRTEELKNATEAIEALAKQYDLKVKV